MQIGANTKGGVKPIDEERKAWSHAISNSEDVPCTKWPPARRSKGMEKRCWRFIRNTTEVEGDEGRVLFFRVAFAIFVRSYRGGWYAHS